MFVECYIISNINLTCPGKIALMDIPVPECRHKRYNPVLEFLAEKDTLLAGTSPGTQCIRAHVHERSEFLKTAGNIPVKANFFSFRLTFLLAIEQRTPIKEIPVD